MVHVTDATPEHAVRSARTPGATAAHRGVRRQKALETRWRIMDAALAEFTERGYHDTTMAAIAERAGVAVQTVYLGSARRADFWRSSSATPCSAARATVRSDRPTRPRRSGARWPSPTAPQRSPLGSTRRFRSTSAPRRSATPGVRPTLSDPESPTGGCGARRCDSTDACRWCEALADHGSLRADLSVEEAADVLATTLSPQSFLAFTVDRGWTVDHLGTWLKDALPRLLLARR